MTHRLDARLNRYAPAVLSVFRVVFALVYAAHGSSKLFGWPVDFATSAAAADLRRVPTMRLDND